MTLAREEHLTDAQGHEQVMYVVTHGWLRAMLVIVCMLLAAVIVLAVFMHYDYGLDLDSYFFRQSQRERNRAVNMLEYNRTKAVEQLHQQLCDMRPKEPCAPLPPQTLDPALYPDVVGPDGFFNDNNPATEEVKPK